MHFKPNHKLIAEKLAQQEKPNTVGTLKRVDCEIGNLLDSGELNEEWRDIFTDLRQQVVHAI